MTEDSSKYVALNHAFLAFFGMFHAMWAGVELGLCYGIAKFLKIPPEEAHVLTSGMEFGRKITLLRNVVYRSDDPDKGKITGLLGKIQNESKRNVFAHSFIFSDAKSVTFIERSRGGDYKVMRHEFTLEDFVDHVENFGIAADQLTKLLGATNDELQRFAEAAFNAETKPTKSPVPPTSSAL
jgi:hypothetical protein